MEETSIVKTARFNIEKDAEILKLIEEKGLKAVIDELYQFYKEHKDSKMVEINELNSKLDCVLMELKNKPVYAEPKAEPKNAVNELVKGFMKGLAK